MNKALIMDILIVACVGISTSAANGIDQKTKTRALELFSTTPAVFVC